MATDQELQHIWTWNGTVPETVNECVGDLLTSRGQPDATAICAWDGELTYSELDTLSSRLAHHLMGMGVGSDSIVPLCYEKSRFMPLAMLAVMKAGGASCTIDVTQPEARLRVIMEQIQPQVVLSSVENRHLAKSLMSAKGETSIVAVDMDFLDQLPVTLGSRILPPPLATPSSTLYIVFTSGSTGTPKAVVITHSNFSSALIHQTSQLGFSRSSRVLDMASYAFDAAWYNVFHTLYAGGCLCIPSESDRRSDLSGCIRRLRPNFANLTPKLCEFLDDDALRILDLVELAGEQADARTVSRMRELTRVRFAYGPAECSILSTVSTEDASCTNIGRGLGICTWVVNADDTDCLVSPGEIGELWIEGPLVGQGYLNDTEKTAAAFVDDPPWLLRGAPGIPGRSGRLYRTGDYVRYDEKDASLLFAGRKDAQVKINGQRVELGEVEHNIAQSLPDIAGLEVLAEVIKPSGSDRTMLVAFFKTVNGIEAAVGPLIESLSQIMPSYMVPSAYLPVEEVPMTQTGKTDRRKLRELGASLTVEQISNLNMARSPWRQPETRNERLLQKLWASVLGVPSNSIGNDDSFLRIGGDSIRAMRLVAAARREGLSLTVADIFNQPKLCDIAAFVEGSLLSDERISTPVHPYSLMARGVAEVRDLRHVAADLCDVKPWQIEDIFPCTPLQEGLLALTAKIADSFVVRISLEFQSSVNMDRFMAACEYVVRNAPILRTRIVDLGTRTLSQVVITEPIDWNVETNTQHVMGLGTPLTRFAVREGNSGRRFFEWTMHHAMCDGWSVQLLSAMLEDAYRGNLVPEPARFQEFVQYIRSVDEEQAEAFWRKHLDGNSSQSFPPRPCIGYQAKSDAEVAHRIANLCWPRRGTTPSTLIQAAWAILVAQYTASNDIVFGSTISGRQASVAGVEQMLGPTIATVPVRVVLDYEGSVDQLLHQMQAHEHERTRFEQMGLQWIRRLGADAEAACDFQTLLVVQLGESEAAEEGALFVSGARNAFELGVFNPYAIMLECQAGEHGVQFRASFDSSAIDAGQMTRMMLQLEHILRQLCRPGGGAKLLGRVETASEQDVHDLVAWNAPVPMAVEGVSHQFVHDIISSLAQEQPLAPAVCAWDGDLTYQELDTMSSQLARRLRQAGVGTLPEMIVPLCMDKSKWVPVSMLGILKAGAAFASLSPSLPHDRLANILDSIKPRPTVVVTSGQQASRFPHATIVSPGDDGCVDDDEEKTFVAVTPSGTAVVLFTSGTSGRPKGIMLDHMGIATTARGLGRDLLAGPTTRVFQFSSYLFDVSIHETFMVLTHGGCLCIPSEAERANDPGAALVTLRANWACLAPSMARALPTDSLPTLDTLVFAGEALTEDDVVKWTEHVRIFNWYGPAECALSTVTPVHLPRWTDGMLQSGSRALPSANECWVVGSNTPHTLAPVGAVGELVVQGPGVMKGYLASPSMDVLHLEAPPWRQRADPCTSLHRLYHTGDLVRRNLDGSLIYIGRKDAQVKIRGQRVELADIEYHVRRALNAEAVVADVLGGSLVAFVYARTLDLDLDLIDIDGLLAHALPAYMMPSAYMAVDHIPLTENGKTDRRKLRAMGAQQLAMRKQKQKQKQKRQPTTTKESLLQKLWISVLPRDLDVEIGVEDNFIRTGGDSIAAMRLVAAARNQGLSFTVADVFKQQRLCDLATVARMMPTVETSAVSIPPFSLLPPHVRDQLPPLALHDAFPVTSWQATCIRLALKTPPRQWHHFALNLPPTLSQLCASNLCARLWDAVPILRVVFVPVQTGYIQLLTDQPLPLTTHYSRVETTAQLATRICEEDALRPGSLGTPFTHFFLLSGCDGTLRLVMRLSHAQYDGTTLIHMMDFLRAVSQDEPLPVFTGFSPFLQHAADRRHSCLAFWESVLHGSSVAILPPDPIKLKSPSSKSALAVEKLIAMPNSSGSYTAATVFTAACAKFLAKATKSGEDVTFGRLVSGRAMLPVHLRNIMGPCVNIIPVRARFPTGADSTQHILESVHQQHLAGLAFETIDFDDMQQICPDWPHGLRSFACVTHYQDLGDAEEMIAGTSCRLEFCSGNSSEAKMMDDAVVILASPIGHQLRVEIRADGALYARETVAQWLDELATLISAFSHCA